VVATGGGVAPDGRKPREAGAKVPQQRVVTHDRRRDGIASRELEVLRIKRQLPEATEQAERALDLYDRKGNLVSVRRVRRLLNELG
jgi:hypothetical protein